MESVGFKLSQEEQIYYGQLFTSLDSDKSGKIDVEAVLQLINRSNLPSHSIEKITQLCGANSLKQFSPSQFYVALKLISMAQHDGENKSLSISPSFLSSNSLLPQFYLKEIKSSEKLDEEKCDSKMDTKHFLLPSTNNHNHVHNKVNSVRNRSNSLRTRLDSTNDNVMSINGQHKWDRNSSLDNMSDISFPYEGKSWSEFEGKNDEQVKRWDEFEEGHHLLSNEDDDEEDGYEDVISKDKIINEEKEVIIEDNSSEGEEDDLWVISKEQKEYYLNQYKRLEKDVNGKIGGNVAREFFEKSNLPVDELSHIWHLSDMDQDGALTSHEFCIAMHLVILRRNKIELPIKLPASLVPVIDMMIGSGINTSKHIPNNGLTNVIPQSKSTLLTTSITPQSNNSLMAQKVSPQIKEWTIFRHSPTDQIKCDVIVTSSPTKSTINDSSQQTEHLANFDFNASSIAKDPKIVHPVEMRISPDGQTITCKGNAAQLFHNNINGYKSSLSPIIAQQQQSQVSTLVRTNTLSPSYKRNPPPPPPPRPSKSGHGRSSSLDLNKLINTSDSNLSNFHNKPYSLTITNPILPNGKPLCSKQESAFMAYKRSDLTENMSSTSPAAKNILMESIFARFQLPNEVEMPNTKLNDISELMKVIRSHQKRDQVVEHIHNELMVELCQVIEAKLSLEAKIKQMKVDNK